MRLQIEARGIAISLTISNYQKREPWDWPGPWCRSDFSFRAAPWLDYCVRDDEVFVAGDVDALWAETGRLLRGELTEAAEIEPTEPDFVFRLFPGADIRLEWEVRFWRHGLTATRLTVTLGRQEIQWLHHFLALSSGRLTPDSPEICKMLRLGVLSEKGSS